MISTDWSEKYRPKTIDDMVLDESIKNMIADYLEKGTIQNILLEGKQGIGKTSLAKVIATTIAKDNILYINASDENGIDVIRTKIKDFSESVGFESKLKIVIFDESDYLSIQAQAGLRNLIESCIDDTRFILTCNYVSKIIDPIQSRCLPIKLKYTSKDILKRILYILKQEGIKCINGDAKEIKEIVEKNYPDIRRIIKILEQCCINGKFEKREIENFTDIENVAKFILQNIKNLKTCREYWIKNQNLFSNDYQLLASTIFNLLDNANQMLICGEYLYRMGFVVDKEIQFTSMIIQLSKNV